MNKFRERRGVSPVIAVLLLIAIAVAAGILVYVWVSGLVGTLTSTGGAQTTEQLELEAYDWTTTSTLTLYVRNVGGSKIIIDEIYVQEVGGSIINHITGTSIEVSVGSTETITITNFSTNPTTGATYVVKIITKTGAIFNFKVIAGRSG